MKQHVGLIGVGNVGGRMAKDLAEAGYPLTVFDTSREALARAEGHGANVGISPKDVASRADIVLLSLPNSDIVDSVVEGKEGVLEGLADGKLIVDMSTSLPKRTLRLVDVCKARKARMIDAPISFGADGMDIMVGGPQEWFEEAKPIFDVVGHKATWVGPHSHGNVTKLVQNMISGVGIAVIAEMLAFAVKAGVDPERMLEAIRTTGAGSRQLNYGLPRMLAHDFGTGGQLALHYKDVKYALQTAHEMNAITPFTAALYEVFNGALAHGDNRWAQVGCITYWENLMGIEVGSGKEDAH
jgi:3-hydroxyisobutyrate dehydrogenase-like beta-hydroxyacid dehydrogenase